MEGSHSGLVHHVGNVAWGNPPRVRISHPPQLKVPKLSTSGIQSFF